MTCGKCASYSRSLQRCVYGKVNPRTKKATDETIDTMGISYICLHNKWASNIAQAKRLESK